MDTISGHENKAVGIVGTLHQGGSGDLGPQVYPPPLIEPVEEYQKPRLSQYRALMSRDTVDLEFVVDSFREWSQYPEWLVFHGEHKHTGEMRFKAIKSAKRGNGVYSWKIKKRMAELTRSLPDVEFFNHRDRSSRHRTRALFVTLTLARNQRLDLAWEQIGEAWNRFMSRMRRRYGPVHGFRVWEAQRDGYPHIHAMLVFETAEFDTFHFNGVWRVQGKRESLEDLWPHGYSDYEGMAGVKSGFRYLTKYLAKLHGALGTSPGASIEAGDLPARELNNLQYSSSQLTLPLMWIFGKRAFGVSKGFVDLILEMTNSNTRGPGVLDQVDLVGSRVWSWRLMGFWGGYLGPRWSRELSLKEIRELKSSPSWTYSRDYR